MADTRALALYAKSDGTWLEFSSSDGKKAALRIESLAEGNGIIVSALRQWCRDRQADALAPTDAAPSPDLAALRERADEDVRTIREAADFLDSAISLTQPSFDSGPEPTTAWDHEACSVVVALRDVADRLAAIPTARTEAAVPDEVRKLAEQAIHDFNKATAICRAQGQLSPLINREVKLARALLGKAGE